MVRSTVPVMVLIAAVLAATPVLAQESAADKTMANANNPLANMVAFNVQNYHYSELYGTDESANTAWLRYAQPFGKWLMRASLPISTVPWVPRCGRRAPPQSTSTPSRRSFSGAAC